MRIDACSSHAVVARGRAHAGLASLALRRVMVACVAVLLTMGVAGCGQPREACTCGAGVHTVQSSKIFHCDDFVKEFRISDTSVSFAKMYLSMPMSFVEHSQWAPKFARLERYEVGDTRLYMSTDHSDSHDYLRLEIRGSTVARFSANIHTNDQTRFENAQRILREKFNTLSEAGKSRFRCGMEIDQQACNYRFGMTFEMVLIDDGLLGNPPGK